MIMNKKLLLLFVMLIPLFGFSQSRFSININGGYDYNIDKYYSPNTYKKFENGQTDFNFGFDVGFRLSETFRFRVEFKYAEFSYGQYYLTSGDLLKTEMTLNCMNINPRLDYRIWAHNNFELFLTTGIRLEYVMDDNQESMRADGNISTRNYISLDFDDNMSGLIGGAILKYKLSDHWGISFTPEYTLFFDELYHENSGVLQRFSTNVGIEWTF